MSSTTITLSVLGGIVSYSPPAGVTRVAGEGFCLVVACAMVRLAAVLLRYVLASALAAGLLLECFFSAEVFVVVCFGFDVLDVFFEMGFALPDFAVLGFTELALL